MMSRNEKVLVVLAVAVLIFFAVQGRKDTIEEMAFENQKLEDQNNILKEKVARYAAALDEANDNIELGDFMIEDAKGSAELSCQEMKKTLSELEIIRSADSPEIIEEEFRGSGSKQEVEFPVQRGDVIVDPVIIKKDKAGFCHVPGTDFYGAVSRYSMFGSLEECLESGGKLPK